MGGVNLIFIESDVWARSIELKVFVGWDTIICQCLADHSCSFFSKDLVAIIFFCPKDNNGGSRKLPKNVFDLLENDGQAEDITFD